ncbi:hypothetical protein GCM10022225_46930 [Plantactinospora mayteni]|uniref:Uncharacterized protein n=1 Tax=Plantactinospora mayteni TaxID=566021 RepID=A0ABQ4EX32_9ACTN|nr:hypothetical protein [Plantactinospora mayteni]GIG99228.1 hypothetical protein Pma05_58010 [Plantactinospora mayteni]
MNLVHLPSRSVVDQVRSAAPPPRDPAALPVDAGTRRSEPARSLALPRRGRVEADRIEADRVEADRVDEDRVDEDRIDGVQSTGSR